MRKKPLCKLNAVHHFFLTHMFLQPWHCRSLATSLAACTRRPREQARPRGLATQPHLRTPPPISSRARRGERRELWEHGALQQPNIIASLSKGEENTSSAEYCWFAVLTQNWKPRQLRNNPLTLSVSELVDVRHWLCRLAVLIY